ASAGVLSTRKIAAGANPLTAPSLGDSGDLKIEAPAITISSGSELLAGVEDGRMFMPGAIDLTADDTAIRQETSFLPVFVHNKTATATSRRTPWAGATPAKKRRAEDQNFSQALGAYVDRLTQNSFGLLGQFPQMVTSLVTGSAAQVDVRSSQATITATDSSI